MNLKKRGLSLLLVLILIVSGSAQAVGKKAGDTPSAVKRTVIRYFIRTDVDTAFHTGDMPGQGRQYSVDAGNVFMLYGNDYYVPEDGNRYYVVYYRGTKVHVACSDVTLLRSAQMEKWIREEIWSADSFTSLLQSAHLSNDINVYALQYALKILGYYTQTLDGGYGENTAYAVTTFQRDFGLPTDGDAGKNTLPLLYRAALDVGPVWYASVTGTLTTVSRTVIRSSPSRSARGICKVGSGSTLTYERQAVTGAYTWYYVLSEEGNGWILANDCSFN